MLLRRLLDTQAALYGTTSSKQKWKKTSVYSLSAYEPVFVLGKTKKLSRKQKKYKENNNTK